MECPACGEELVCPICGGKEIAGTCKTFVCLSCGFIVHAHGCCPKDFGFNCEDNDCPFF